MQSQGTARNVDGRLHHLVAGLPNSGLWTGLSEKVRKIWACNELLISQMHAL